MENIKTFVTIKNEKNLTKYFDDRNFELAEEYDEGEEFELNYNGLTLFCKMAENYTDDAEGKRWLIVEFTLCGKYYDLIGAYHADSHNRDYDDTYIIIDDVNIEDITL